MPFWADRADIARVEPTIRRHWRQVWPFEISRSDRLRFFRAWHSQMRDLSDLEAKLLARRSYELAMSRLDYTKVTPAPD